MSNEAEVKTNDSTTPSNYPFSEFFNKRLKQYLSSSLSCSEDLIDAFMGYFYDAELIANGCHVLSDLSLTGKK